MYENLARYVAEPRDLTEEPDEKVVGFLRQAIINVFNGHAVCRDHADPHGIRTVLKEVFRRCAMDGLDSHASFIPVAVAMGKIPQEGLHQDQALAEALKDEIYENPWKKLTEGRRDIPEQQYYDIM